MGGADLGLPITVVLVDPDSYLAALFASGGLDVCCVATPDDAARVVAQLRPRVVVIDLDGARARVDGVAAIGGMTTDAPDVPVLAVSSEASPAVVLAAVGAGAAGFLRRTSSVLDLLDAVRRTAAGEVVYTPGLAAAVLDAYGRLGGPVPVGAARLTEREADVLRLVVDGLTARQIASRLVLSPRTVENHIQRVLRKLNLPNRAALIRYAIQQGLA